MGGLGLHMSNFDITIIGAGLAGLQCARDLSAKGIRVLLVDRKADLTKGVHTTGIFVRKTFEDFEFPPGTLGRPIRNVERSMPITLRPYMNQSDALSASVAQKATSLLTWRLSS